MKEAEETNEDKLKREAGLCVSLVKNDIENADRIIYILNTFLVGKELGYATRSNEDWKSCDELPINFSSYRYRIIQKERP